MGNELITIESLASKFGLTFGPIPSNRGAKQNPYSQDKLILQVLKRGGAFNESELGKIIYGKDYVGARTLIHVLREKGYTESNLKDYFYDNH